MRPTMRMTGILATLGFLGLLAVPAQAGVPVWFRLEVKGKTPVDLKFWQVTGALDQILMAKPAVDKAFKTRKDELRADEDARYKDTGFVAAKTGDTFNGYTVGTNEVSNRQICGGLALSGLIGGPYPVPSPQAQEVVRKLGTEITDKADLKANDIVVWCEAEGGNIQHFALVWKKDADGNILIVSKDGPERVLTGRLDRFPAKVKGYGPMAYYRLDWKAIKVKNLGLAGTWNSDWGPVTLVHGAAGADDKPLPVTGFWIQGKDKRGTITAGTYDPKTGRLVFSYAQPWNKQQGKAELTLSADGKGLQGSWKHASGGGGSWSMSRKYGQ